MKAMLRITLRGSRASSKILRVGLWNARRSNGDMVAAAAAATCERVREW